uniref:Uncharacterized protein n=1 Tax=Siphoviridae sp. ctcMb1 TaxID=2827276 RepID=A0A8S5R5J5_9CAUD|nr:MAG TPA: hypothetical protein [Siphoviridae sp. ctcMb1]DAG26297.1 MAG TPA: hypothetical protein [Caudoviricetes sp.]DAH05263.1 MAG TPA: hypothetical protein [Caudoviricetes sp.]DAJ76442.1 MAG TPA: hypothetical protein [Caudoviricetes sp.]DAM54676.1 MAG TPA: hypothetical protein [Caudoviricetes sp.]
MRPRAINIRYKCGNSKEMTVATFFVLSRQSTADKGKEDRTWH